MLKKVAFRNCIRIMQQIFSSPYTDMSNYEPVEATFAEYKGESVASVHTDDSAKQVRGSVDFVKESIAALDETMLRIVDPSVIAARVTYGIPNDEYTPHLHAAVIHALEHHGHLPLVVIVNAIAAEARKLLQRSQHETTEFSVRKNMVAKPTEEQLTGRQIEEARIKKFRKENADRCGDQREQFHAAIDALLRTVAGLGTTISSQGIRAIDSNLAKIAKRFGLDEQAKREKKRWKEI